MKTKRQLILRAALPLAILSGAALAHAGEILFMSTGNFVTPAGTVATYSQSGGQFSAGTRTNVGSLDTNSIGFSQGGVFTQQAGSSVPYVWTYSTGLHATRLTAFTYDGSAFTEFATITPACCSVLGGNMPGGVEDASGNLYFTDTSSHLRKVTPDGTVTQLNSSDQLRSMTMSQSGTIYAANVSGTIEKYSTSGDSLGTFGTISTGRGVYSLAFDTSGNLFGLINRGGSQLFGAGGWIYKWSSSGGTPTLFATLAPSAANAWDMTIDSSDNLWVSEQGQIQEITSSGSISTFVSSATGAQSVAVIPSSTPEPGSWALMLTGAAVLTTAAVRRRRGMAERA